MTCNVFGGTLNLLNQSCSMDTTLFRPVYFCLGHFWRSHLLWSLPRVILSSCVSIRHGSITFCTCYDKLQLRTIQPIFSTASLLLLLNYKKLKSE